MCPAVLGDFYFLLTTLARIKFFLEMNLQLINVIGDTLTNLVDFFPFVSIVSNETLHFVKLSLRFESFSPIR